MIKILIVAALWPAVAASAAQHQVTQKDHLWGLAEKYYGNPHGWRRIAEANAGIVKDPHWIYPGQVLEIPEAPAAVEASLALPAAPAPAWSASAAAAAEESPTVPAAVAPSVAAPEPAPTPIEEQAAEDDYAAGAEDADGLSDDMPPALTGYTQSMPRLKLPADFKPAGIVVEFDPLAPLAVAGVTVSIRLAPSARVSTGERLTVYRPTGAFDTDADKKARYVQVVGSVKALPEVRGKERQFIVLKTGEAVSAGDWVTQGGR